MASSDGQHVRLQSRMLNTQKGGTPPDSTQSPPSRSSCTCPPEVHQGRSVRAFAQAVFRHSQAADIRSQYNQITQAWTKLHPNLRCPRKNNDSRLLDIAAAANRRGNFPNPGGRGREYSFNRLMNNT
ncbi:hypothetical protein V8E54_012682 [Elaphomyces granulatus]